MYVNSTQRCGCGEMNQSQLQIQLLLTVQCQIIIYIISRHLTQANKRVQEVEENE